MLVGLAAGVCVCARMFVREGEINEESEIVCVHPEEHTIHVCISVFYLWEALYGCLSVYIISFLIILHFGNVVDAMIKWQNTISCLMTTLWLRLSVHAA